ncbi:MAG: hypothetical protein H0W78_14565, partial [Planctomycetes bacterium]|nr:hypothetical protein [Planctomycetota bacterium]
MTALPAMAGDATVITWNQPTNITYGTPISVAATASNSSGPVAGTFVYNPPLGTVLQQASGNQRITATFTPASGGRTLRSNKNMQVSAAPLSVTCTATKVFGAAMPTLTPTYSGFVNGDTAGSVLTGSPALSTTATAGSPVGSYPITVTRGTLSANNNYSLTYVTGSLTVTPATSSVTLSNLARTFDGAGKAATVTTVPAGLTTSVTYNGNAALPVNAGSYAVVATVTNPNYTGTANGTLTIAPAAATVTLSGLANTYDGAGKAATVTTAPAGLSGTITYGGNAALPVNAGSYAVVATITDANYTGSANGTLTIAPAVATVTISGLAHTYDGAGKTATVTTAPAGLVGTITYGGNTALPVNAGSYAVVATVTDPNYTGSANGNLTIAQAVATVTLSDLAHTYDGNGHGATVTTAPAGLPLVVSYDASNLPPMNAGSYDVVASVFDPNYTGSASDTLTIAQAGQTITFAELADTMVGDADQPLNASATSGLPVTFTISGPAGIVAGALRVTDAGTVTVTATQAGDGNWAAALPVERTITVSPATGGGLLASYFANMTLSGAPVLSRIDTQVNFDWANGSPAPGVVPTNNFSVRWDGEIVPRFNEAYTLTFRTDDGVRVWFNGLLIVNHWYDRGVANSNYTFSAQAGQPYRIRMEYYENGGQAVAQLRWSSASETAGPIPSSQLLPTPPDTSGPVGTGTGLGAAYFANETLTGMPAVSRVDARVDFNWGGGSPATGIPVDSFSARWTGDIQTRYTEPYTLILRSDDGVRMWLDGQLVINDWVLRGATNSTYTFNAEAGRRYRIQIEYFERFGSAVAQLHWYSAREFSGAIPATQLYPLPTPVVQVADVPQLKAEGEPVNLSGTVSNTGTASMAYAWTQVSGPAAATFQTANQIATAAHFPVAGTYEVQLSAFNGHVVVSDSTVITVVAPDLNSALVAHYTFDEASGDRVIDSSGKQHTGILYGATRTTGKQGGALRFNGTTFVYVQGNEDLDPTTPALTLAAWLKPDRTLAQMAHPYPMPIYRADYATSTGYALMVTANETERLGLRIHHLAGTGQRMETFTAQALTPNTWVHVAGVYNGSVMSIHLNGVQVASRTVGAINVRAAGELAMFLGKGFEGLMDDVRIYHRALSGSDLAALAQGGLNQQAPGVNAGTDQIVSMASPTITL